MDYVGFGVQVPQEPEPRQDGGEPPTGRLDVQDVDLQQVAGLGAVDVHRSGQGVDQVQVGVEQIGGLGGGRYLHIEGIAGLHHDLFARVGGHGRRDVGMPAVMPLVRFVATLPRIVQLYSLHGPPPEVNE